MGSNLLRTCFATLVFGVSWLLVYFVTFAFFSWTPRDGLFLSEVWMESLCSGVGAYFSVALLEKIRGANVLVAVSIAGTALSVLLLVNASTIASAILNPAPDFLDGTPDFSWQDLILQISAVVGLCVGTFFGYQNRWRW